MHRRKVRRQSNVSAALLLQPEAPAPARIPGIDERQGKLLRQRCRRNLLQNDQGRADLGVAMGNQAASRDGHLPIHQRLLQSLSKALSIGLEKPFGLRAKGRLSEQQERHESVKRPIWK